MAEKPESRTPAITVAGEVLLRLAPDADRRARRRVPGGVTRAVTALSVNDVDRVLHGLDVVGITRLHGGWGRGLRDHRADAAADRLGRTYRVRYTAPDDPDEVAARLVGVAGVEQAGVNQFRWALSEKDGPGSGSQEGLARINLGPAWYRTIGEPGVRIALIDTGVDLDNPDILMNLERGMSFVELEGMAVPPAHDLARPAATQDPLQDDVGQGTHVAALIVGTCRLIGMAPACHLIPVKVLARAVYGGRVVGVGTAVDAARGIIWAADQAAAVLCLGFGGHAERGCFAEEDAIEYATALGAVVLAGAGNEPDAGPAWPAAFGSAGSVAAIDADDELVKVSSKAGFDGLVAPGARVHSVGVGGEPEIRSGTAIAAAHAAGVAALMKSMAPQLTEAEVSDFLRETADPVRRARTDLVPNEDFGFGAPDAGAALDFLAGPGVHALAPEPEQPPTADPGDGYGSWSDAMDHHGYDDVWGGGYASGCGCSGSGCGCSTGRCGCSGSSCGCCGCSHCRCCSCHGCCCSGSGYGAPACPPPCGKPCFGPPCVKPCPPPCVKPCFRSGPCPPPCVKPCFRSGPCPPPCGKPCFGASSCPPPCGKPCFSSGACPPPCGKPCFGASSCPPPCGKPCFGAATAACPHCGCSCGSGQGFGPPC